jgi:hypothetical protein
MTTYPPWTLQHTIPGPSCIEARSFFAVIQFQFRPLKHRRRAGGVARISSRGHDPCRTEPPVADVRLLWREKGWWWPVALVPGVANAYYCTCRSIQLQRLAKQTHRATSNPRPITANSSSCKFGRSCTQVVQSEEQFCQHSSPEVEIWTYCEIPDDGGERGLVTLVWGNYSKYHQSERAASFTRVSARLQL